MMQIFEPDDPLVLNGTYNVYGFTPNEWKARERRLAKEQAMKKARELVRTTVEDLPVQLTNDELRVYGAQLATQTTEIQSVKDRHKDLRKEMRDELKTLEADRDALAAKMERGTENRQVAVEVWYDNEQLTVEMVRTDTLEKYFTRKMTDDELQLRLPK